MFISGLIHEALVQLTDTLRFFVISQLLRNCTCDSIVLKLLLRVYIPWHVKETQQAKASINSLSEIYACLHYFRTVFM